MMQKRLAMAMVAAIGALAATLQPAGAQEAPMTALRPDQAAFRAIYKELVETNTSLSAGSCTLAAERMAAHLKAAGYADADITLFSVPEHPKDGGLVAILPGTDPSATTGSVTPSSSSRKTAFSMRAAPPTTNRWRRSSPTPWSG